MPVRLLTCCLLFIANGPVLAQLHTSDTIEIETGLIAGIAAESDPSISVFNGLPFAAPPVGDLRWRPPARPIAWEGVRDASAFGPAAPQRASTFGGIPEGYPTSEDCLYLNVWTPATSDQERLPVMVWIHGGGFSIGAGSNPLYDGTHFAEAGVVLVTINYRLGIFGAFAHPSLTRESEYGASGNYGLMDQVAALAWVQRNIAAFGGDPGNVTIFGESAGGRSVSLLMVAPSAKGLFHRAIAHSGALRDTTFTRESRETIGTDLVAAMGLADAPDLLAELRAVPWEDFPNAGTFPSNPIVDGWLIPENAEILYARGAQHNVPLIAGTNADEATFRLVNDPPRSVRAYEEYLRKTFKSDGPSLMGAFPAGSDAAAYDVANAIGTDASMTIHARHQVRWMANVNADAYLYHFTRVPPNGAGRLLGSHHGAEIQYVFGNLAPEDPFSDTDTDLSRAMRTSWVQFAKTGNPNGDHIPEWRPYDARQEWHMEFGDSVRAGQHLRKEALDKLEFILFSRDDE